MGASRPHGRSSLFAVRRRSVRATMKYHYFHRFFTYSVRRARWSVFQTTTLTMGCRRLLNVTILALSEQAWSRPSSRVTCRCSCTSPEQSPAAFASRRVVALARGGARLRLQSVPLSSASWSAALRLRVARPATGGARALGACRTAWATGRSLSATCSEDSSRWGV